MVILETSLINGFYPNMTFMVDRQTYIHKYSKL